MRLEFTGINVAPVTDLRVAFDIDKHDGQQFNHAKIVVFNMGITSRAAVARPIPLDGDLRFDIARPVLGVRLFVGYQSQLVHVFSGDILWSHNNRDGPDWVTQMELFTGLAAATGTSSQVSFAGLTPARTVLEDLAKPLGLLLRYTTAAAAALEDKQVLNYTASGMAYREADEFLKRYGLAFTIEDDGSGLVYVPTEARDPQEGLSGENLFSPDTGLVGTPQITRSGIEITSLLRPNMKLFQRFFVRSETTQGTLRSPDYSPDYYAVFVRHIGDTRAEEWFTEIEGAYSTFRQQ